jgi:UDP-3-O-[3-hydroxymyristoyl] glucosamine N-acyltransferase
MAEGFRFTEILAFLEGVGGRLINGDALGSSTSTLVVRRLVPLGESREGDCAFFFSRDYQTELLSAMPGILVTGEPFVGPLQAQAAVLPFWKKTAIIACRDPYLGMAILSEKFAAVQSTVAHLPGTHRAEKPSVHASAVVDPTAQIAEGATIGPHCVVEAGARIGKGTVLYPRVYVGPSVEIGEDSVLFPGVTLYESTKLGKRVRIHAGSVLGADGFGYAPRIENGAPVGHQKIYHLGRVVIGDDVEIGANTMIDRATLGETRIDAGAKLDNDIHIGHNSMVGAGTILCGGVTLAGGTTIGKFVYVGGLTGMGNKATVGDYAKIAGMSSVSKDVPPGGTCVGRTQRTYRDHFRLEALLNRMLAAHNCKDRRSASAGDAGEKEEN